MNSSEWLFFDNLSEFLEAENSHLLVSLELSTD